MKRVLLLGLSVLAVLSWLSPAEAEYKAALKLACTQSMDHPYMVGAQKFADLIKERTKGRITVKLYPSNQLGKGEREMTEGIQQGAIDLLVTSTGPLGGFSPVDQHPRLSLPLQRFQACGPGSGRGHRAETARRLRKGQHQGPGLLGKRIPPPDQFPEGGQEGRGRQGAQDPDHGKQGAPGGLEGRGVQSHTHVLGRGVHGAAADGSSTARKTRLPSSTATSCGMPARSIFRSPRMSILRPSFLDEQEDL